MQFEVPQYVELEDKLAFRLTLKQLGWFALGGIILFILWSLLEKWAFWVSFPFIAGAAAAFAFYKPAGLTLITFLIDGAKYFIKPKELTWEKGSDDITMEDKFGKRDLDTTDIEYQRTIKRKRQDIEDIGDLAKVLDKSSDL